MQLSDEEIAFYDIILLGKDYVESDEMVRQIARDVTASLKKNLKIDWLNQEKVKSDIRVKVAEILLKAEFPTEQVDKLIPVIMRQTESNYGEMEFDS